MKIVTKELAFTSAYEVFSTVQKNVPVLFLYAFDTLMLPIYTPESKNNNVLISILLVKSI